MPAIPDSARRKMIYAELAAYAERLTPATVNKSLAHLERVGVVAELTRKQRGRVFSKMPGRPCRYP